MTCEVWCAHCGKLMRVAVALLGKVGWRKAYCSEQCAKDAGIEQPEAEHL